MNDILIYQTTLRSDLLKEVKVDAMLSTGLIIGHTLIQSKYLLCMAMFSRKTRDLQIGTAMAIQSTRKDVI